MKKIIINNGTKQKNWHLPTIGIYEILLSANYDCCSESFNYAEMISYFAVGTATKKLQIDALKNSWLIVKFLGLLRREDVASASIYLYLFRTCKMVESNFFIS